MPWLLYKVYFRQAVMILTQYQLYACGEVVGHGARNGSEIGEDQDRNPKSGFRPLTMIGDIIYYSNHCHA